MALIFSLPIHGRPIYIIYIQIISMCHIRATRHPPRHIGARACPRGDATCTRAINPNYFYIFLTKLNIKNRNKKIKLNSKKFLKIVKFITFKI